MARIHLTPSLRRLAMLLVAIALVAAISPGLAVAANGPPRPVDDVIDIAENGTATGNVLTNDGNLGDGALTVTGFVALAPSIGTIDVASDGDFSFTPADHWNGSTSTTYGVSNGVHDRTGNILITVTPVNDAPLAVDDTALVDEDAATDITAQLLANDTDLDGDTLSVSGVSNATGGVDFDAGTVTFTPAADDCGTDVAGFDYDISDGNGGSDSASVTVDVTCLNDAPVAVDDTASGSEDMPVTIDPADLLADDTDADDDTLSVSGVSNASGGSVVLDAGTITFTPDADLCGAAGFDYDISDGNGGSDTGHVAIDVTCLNDAPVAVDDTGSVANNPGPTDFDVLVNDTDVEGNSLTLVSASVSASTGSVSVVSGMVRFTPLAAFSGPAVITYVVSDGALTDSGTLTVTVGPDTDLPVATAPTVTFGSARVDETAPLHITWSATDTGSGVASYEVQVSVAGGAFTTIYSGPGTSLDRMYPFNKSLVWRVRATDAATNVSAWATSASRKIVTYGRSASNLTYTGTWTKVSSAGSSGTGYSYTRTLGKRATLSFTGLEILYIAPKNTASGYAKVYADGKLIGRFNLRASTSQLGRIITSKKWGSSGAHTMRVVNDQSGRRTNLDAFIVLK
jgi:hypothetical protein